MGKWEKVASRKDIVEGKAIKVIVNGKEIALFKSKNIVYALDNECSHAGGPLCEGAIDGTTVTCPWHGATFDLSSGTALSAPAYDNINCHAILLDGDDIKLMVSPE